MRDLLIFGSTDIAEVMAAYFMTDARYHLCGFTVDRAYITQENLLGLPVFPFEEVTQQFLPENTDFFVAVAYGDMNRNRHLLIKRVQAAGYALASYIHPSASVMASAMGGNVFVGEHVTIQPFTSIGEGSVIWSGTVIGHHATVDPCCYLGPTAFIGGNVKVGFGSVVGPHSMIASHRSIGKSCFIGAAGRVYNDLEAHTMILEPSSKPARFTTDRLPRMLADMIFNRS